MAWKDALEEGNELVLVTCSKACEPNANVVISQGIVEEKILINDCQMNKTRKNIEENPEVCIIAIRSGEYYRIKGKASVCNEGKYFDIAKGKEIDYEVKNVIIIEVDEVFDLDKLEIVN